MFLLLNMKKGEKKPPKDGIEIYKLFIRQSLRINGYINGPMVAAYGNIFPRFWILNPLGLCVTRVNLLKLFFNMWE